MEKDEAGNDVADKKEAVTPPSDEITTRDGNEFLYHREATFTPKSFDKKARTIEVVFSTGAAFERYDYWTDKRYIEELKVSKDAVDLTRMNVGAPVLNSHSRWDVESIMGVVERAWIDGKEAKAIVRFSEREDVAPLMKDVEAGIIRNISAGYTVSKWEIRSENGVEYRTAARWMPHEISFVAIPADPKAQVRTADTTTGQNAALAAQKERKMDETDASAGNAPKFATIEQLEAIKERSKGRLDDTWVLKQMKDKVTLERAMDIALDAMATTQTADINGANAAATAHSSQQRDLDGLRGTPDFKRMSDAVFIRMGGSIDEKDTAGRERVQAARDYVNVGLQGLLREMLVRSGHKRAHLLTGGALWDHIVRERAHSTSDFPLILGDAANKYLQETFEGMPRGYESWTKARDVGNFLQVTTANIGRLGALEKVVEGAPVTNFSQKEEGEKYALDTYGKIATLTRQAIINDNLSAFATLMQSAGQTSVYLIRNLVYGLLKANGNTADGNALFSAAHLNIVTSGGAPDEARVGALRQLLNEMKDVNGQQIGPTLRNTIIVPPAREVAALKVASTVIPEQISNVNTQNRFITAVDVAPEMAVTNNPWVVAANERPTIEVLYLDGRRVPEVTEAEQFDYLGVSFRVIFDVAAAVASFRGMAMDDGA